MQNVFLIPQGLSHLVLRSGLELGLDYRKVGIQFYQFDYLVLMARVRGSKIHYVNECPHKYNCTNVCVCVCVCVCV